MNYTTGSHSVDRSAARVSRLLAGAALVGIFAGVADAAITTQIVYDTFNIGPSTAPTRGTNNDDADDPWDIPFYRNTNHTGAFSAELDTVLGGAGNYSLRYRPYQATPRSIIGTLYGASGNVAPVVALANVGDQVRLTFDFRRPEDANNTFLFGLYNQGGTPTTDHNTTNNNRFDHSSNDSYGYFAKIGVIGNATTELYKESGGNGGVTAGLDTMLLATGETPIAAALTVKYTAVLTITREAGGAQVAFSILDANGATLAGASAFDAGGHIINGSAPQNAYLSFDEIAFSVGGNGDSIRLDNIHLELIAVPEPVALGVLGVGAVTLMGRHRRKN